MPPLTDLGADNQYKGQSGVLYGNGGRQAPEKHLRAALAEAKRIRPLDLKGKPDPNGKIVLISIGTSNTTIEFQRFQELANNGREKSPHVVIVDGAQGGNDASQWSGLAPIRRNDPWEGAAERLKQAGISPAQVQAVWIKQALQVPERLGEFPAHARELQKHLLGVVQKAHEYYPNVRIAYLSSRIYAGYAVRTRRNPEPYAYESAFSVRWLIEDQIAGKAELNFDAAQGAVKSPLPAVGTLSLGQWREGPQDRRPRVRTRGFQSA